MSSRRVFLTGATGYIGSRLATQLVARGHTVRALVRRGSERKLPAGVEPVAGDALRAETFAGSMQADDTLVQLVGVAHPSPAKATEFRSVDLASALASFADAARARVEHVVYVSVAQPAPAMRAYVAVRAEAEAALAATGLTASVLRPWYVLGPGHRWPYALIPLYWSAALVPSLRDGARRLGLVTIREMVNALVHAVERPPSERSRVWDVPAIRAAGRSVV